LLQAGMVIGRQSEQLHELMATSTEMLRLPG
jgi:hypothetical protein